MSLVAIFKKYAGKKGWCSLSRTEFLTFINTELAVLIKNRKDTGVLDCMMKKLDIDCDGQLDFQEFLNLVGGMAVSRHGSVAHSQKYI